ncbi:MAG: GspE/PulE family protein [Candidatus Sumerlaeia bacterium]
MKSDILRLAGLFFETGMIDAEHFEKCTHKVEKGDKSLVEVLKQDVSLKSIRELQNVAGKSVYDLLTMDIPLPFGQKEHKDGDSDIHAALSRAFYLTNEEIIGILENWKPDIDTILVALKEADALDDTVENVRKNLGKGKGVYRRLVDNGYLGPITVEHAVNASRNYTRRTNRLLLALKMLHYNEIIEESDLNIILENYLEKGQDSIPMLNEEILAFIESEPDMPELRLDDVKPPENLVGSLPLSFIRQNLLLPHQKKTQPMKRLEVVMTDPFSVEITDTLAFLTGTPVVGYYASDREIITRINEIFRPPIDSDASQTPKPSELAIPEPGSAKKGEKAKDTAGKGTIKKATKPTGPEKVPDNVSAVELVSGIIEGGISSRATDVHLEPNDEGLRVRYRIDGRLRKIMDIPASLFLSVTSRIKVLANLDVTERRRAQDGHFTLQIGEGSFDFRVSTLPTHLGEKTVIRILDESRVMLSMEDLGMTKDETKIVEKWINRPHGLLLVTGPTGSGKTSTLYASLNTINSEEKNIVTVEDPVEYRLEGINQVNVDPTFDLTFASGLRSILRQDPDVIMVGEIRDPETARIAMRSALTGHMVFSTLHTNTAAGAIATLLNMGVEAYMLTSAITGVINQRLVRRLCQSCKKQFTPKKALLEELHLNPRSRKRMHEAKGCDECLNSGYLGRIGIFEMMGMTEHLSKGILEGKSETELVEIIRQTNKESLLDSAVAKIYAGETSPQEILDTLGAESD